LAKRDSRHKQPQAGPEKAFGQALREFRKKKELSQEQLALDADFDRTYISLLERGVQSPTLRTVVRLAEILEVPAWQMIQRMETIAGQERHPGSRTSLKR
jgi:transcriptional regulator with XRE-family HTH domain